MKRAKDRTLPKAARIVVLGDSGVGKSSLITVFISAHFEENLSSLIPVAVRRKEGLFLSSRVWLINSQQVLPPEATGESVSITLVDT